ncbi:MAG: redox-sensing transcriptional repressor Rex [Lentisphaerae bacterium GWF2_44_16]|nr:MAG: redox-sensing transcriptional repressor Rex [Lentisphaerae bacterium GWF2_44_16]
MDTEAVEKVVRMPSVKRLPGYLCILRRFQMQGRELVSTTHLAEEIGLAPIVVRKDLEITGITGKPKVGYPVPELIEGIENFLGWNNATDAFLAGVGCLGSALMGYQGIRNNGLNIVAGFDNDPAKIGSTVHGRSILPLKKLPDLVRRMHVRIGILTVPADAAEEVAQMMISAGIKGIWNFTTVDLKTGPDIVVQKEDLSSGLAALSVKLKRAKEKKEEETES